MSFGPKHQRKVNECYPMRPGEEGAVSGKISVLTYYINSRPEKLLKVSAYLEKKVKKDILRERIGYNKVTLDIVDGIMSGCSEYFGSFAETALFIIFTLSQTEDVELLSHVVGTFVHFGTMAKPILPAIRSEDFFAMLTETVRGLLNIRITGGTAVECDIISELEIRTLQTIISMEDFKTFQGDLRMSLLVGTFLRYFSIGTYELQFDGYQMKQATPILEKITNSFQMMVKGMNTVCLEYFMTAIFGIFKPKTELSMEATRFMFLVLIKNIPSQFLCVFLSEIFRQLDKSDEHNLVIFIDTVTDLILSNRGPLGYSAVELANNFIRLLKKQRPPPPANLRASFLVLTASPPPKSVFAICNALVCILRNTNFASQKYEIINHVLSKAFLPKESRRYLMDQNQPALQIPDHHSLATVTLDNVEEEQFRSVTWSVLFAMAEECLPTTVLKLAFVEIPAKLFESLFQMSLNQDSEFRLNSLVLLYRLFLNGLSFSGHSLKRDVSSSQTLNDLPSTPLPKAGQALLAKFRSCIFQSGLIITNRTQHLCIIDALLKIVLREADFNHLITSIALVLKWQLTLEGRLEEMKALLLVLAHKYIYRAGKLLNANRLLHFLDKNMQAMEKNQINVFDLDTVFDESPPPLCLKTSADYQLNTFQLSFAQIKDLLLGEKHFKPSQVICIEEIFKDGTYTPIKDMASFVDSKNEAAGQRGRRSFYPTTPQQPLGMESSETTLLSRRSFINLRDDGNALTVPAYTGSPFTRHLGSSSLSVVSSHTVGGAGTSSTTNRNVFQSNSAAVSRTSVADSDASNSSEVSVLDGDFSSLTLKTKEKNKELRTRNSTFLF